LAADTALLLFFYRVADGCKERVKVWGLRAKWRCEGGRGGVYTTPC